MAFWLRCLITGIVGYLLGTISVGFLLAKLYGVRDIRKTGSGNAGSTNVLRTLGWVPSLLTLLGDCLKAFLAAQIGKWLGGDICLLIGGTAAILGHDFPVFMNFRGGKGIASTLGLIFAIDPRIVLCLFAPFIIIVAVTRYVSVASILAAIEFPILTAIFTRGNPHYMAYVVFSSAVGLLAVFCHRKNIVRLIHHEENRLDFEKISKIKSKIQDKRKNK